jgi:hypothetical protein
MPYQVVLKENVSEKDREAIIQFLMNKGAYIVKLYQPDTRSFSFANLHIHKADIPLGDKIEYIEEIDPYQ